MRAASLTAIKRRAAASLLLLAGIAVGAHLATEKIVAEFSERATGDLSGVIREISLARIGLVFLCLVYLALRLIWPLIRSLEEEKGSLQALNESIAGVTHELRTPLVSLKGGLALLKSPDSGLPAGERDRILRSLERNAARIHRQVEEVLTVSTLAGEALRLERKESSLRELVEGAAQALADYSPRHEVRFSWEGNEGKVLGDGLRLEQVFLNLISNAIKYSPAGGLVEVRGRGGAETHEVEVRDQGLGIPKEAQPRLFEKFSRVQAESHKGISGTGLGLYLVREILRRHGGEVALDSAPGRGSVFRVILPALRAREAA